MNPLTLEWTIKAEGDLRTAKREFRARNAPNYDAVCFHTQQAAEKYLKAVLQEAAIPIPRIHSLIELLVLISRDRPGFLSIQPEANELEAYSVQYRYPGASAEKEDARAALVAADRICAFVRTKLELP